MRTLHIYVKKNSCFNFKMCVEFERAMKEDMISMLVNKGAEKIIFDDERLMKRVKTRTTSKKNNRLLQIIKLN